MRISIPEKTIHTFKIGIILLLWLLTTFTNYSLALTLSPTNSQWDSRLCPENSQCTQAAANLYQKWEALETDLASSRLSSSQKFQQLKKFFTQYGLWVELWHPSTASTLPLALYWDSACPHHKNRILKSAHLMKNGTELPAGHWLEPLLVLNPNGTITTYTVPIGDRPLRLHHGKLEFIRNLKNFYYRLQISPQHHWQLQSIVTTMPPSELGEEIPCPPTLSAHFNQRISPEGLYQSHFCRKLATATILIPWSCAH